MTLTSDNANAAADTQLAFERPVAKGSPRTICGGRVRNELGFNSARADTRFVLISGPRQADKTLARMFSDHGLTFVTLGDAGTLP